MPQISHGYAIGRIRVLEKRNFSRQNWERLTAAKDVPELAKALSESGWGEARDQAGVEELCARRVREACELIKAVTPEPEITDCFFLKYDIINLKALLKARMTGREPPALCANGLLDPEVLRRAVAEARYKDLPGEYLGALEAIEARVAIEPDPLYVDAELDKLLYRMIETRVKGAVPEIREYFSGKADLVNLLTALRVRRMGRPAEFCEGLFVPGGTIAREELFQLAREPELLNKIVAGKPYAGAVRRALARMERGEGLSAIEGEVEKFLAGIFEKGRFEILGILPVARYLVCAEREARDVRLLAVAKAVGISPDALSARLNG